MLNIIWGRRDKFNEYHSKLNCIKMNRVESKEIDKQFTHKAEGVRNGLYAI